MKIAYSENYNKKVGACVRASMRACVRVRDVYSRDRQRSATRYYVEAYSSVVKCASLA